MSTCGSVGEQTKSDEVHCLVLECDTHLSSKQMLVYSSELLNYALAWMTRSG